MDTTAFLVRNALFTTRLFAVSTDRRVDSSSRALTGLAARGLLVRVTRGLWAQPDHPSFTPFGAVGFLLGHEHGHVSFVSALHRHGVIAQIPGAVHIATTGHGRVLESPIGRFEFFQLRPQMMNGGVDVSDTEPPYPIATPEKALLDTIYIGLRRRRFVRLPELDTDDVDPEALKILLDGQVTAPPLRRAVEARLTELGV